MVSLKGMKKIFKLLTAALLTISLGVATVVCCCLGSTAKAQLQKTSACNHCQPQGSAPKHPVNPTDSCTYHLPNAEAFHSQTITAPVLVVSTSITFFDKHVATPFLPSLI